MSLWIVLATKTELHLEQESGSGDLVSTPVLETTNRGWRPHSSSLSEWIGPIDSERERKIGTPNLPVHTSKTPFVQDSSRLSTEADGLCAQHGVSRWNGKENHKNFGRHGRARERDGYAPPPRLVV